MGIGLGPSLSWMSSVNRSKVQLLYLCKAPSINLRLPAITLVSDIHGLLFICNQDNKSCNVFAIDSNSVILIYNRFKLT